MDTDEYVDVDTYHWSQLENDLPQHRQAYTFLRNGDDGEYRVVVDSAMGFYIDDLLAYANINISDVQSMNFYTRDQETGYFTSFSLAELLQSTRYYFEALPAHLIPLYDENGNFQGYDDSEAWQYAIEVRPMLALEDSWVTYEVGTEHVSEDFNSMGTANRFRLLFGQTSPTESRTNQTAKYVYAVNVALDGDARQHLQRPRHGGDLLHRAEGGHSLHHRQHGQPDAERLRRGGGAENGRSGGGTGRCGGAR